MGLVIHHKILCMIFSVAVSQKVESLMRQLSIHPARARAGTISRNPRAQSSHARGCLMSPRETGV